MRNLFTPRAAALMIGIMLIALNISAQKIDNEAATLEQCRNGGTAPGVGCLSPGGATGWVTGNAGSSNSHWAENQFLPYRMLFSGLTVGGSNTVTIGYDITKNGPHAIDYLGTYNYTETNANPCASVAGCTLGSPTSTYAIPPDTVTVTSKINPNTGNPVVEIPGQFTMWGGTITGVAYQPYAGGEERQITVTFTSNVSNPVLAWGGHVGWAGDWGIGNSAGGVSGSPYHMRLIELNGSGGNQDRSLSADAVTPSGAVFIRKQVATQDGTNYSTILFHFTSTNFTADNGGAFDLRDLIPDDPMNPGTPTPGSPIQSGAITVFAPNQTITVTENNIPTGWSLSNVNCVESQTQDSTKNSLLATATIKVQPYEIVTCTFYNTNLAPSAAPASVGGRITDINGRGLRGVNISIVDVTSGDRHSTMTNAFGYYIVEDLPTTDFYTITVTSKRYPSLNQTRSFTLLDNITDLDFQEGPTPFSGGGLSRK